MIANAGSNSLTVDLSFLIPVTSEANQFTDSASLGEPVGIEGLIDAYGGVAKFSRTIFGTSALLAAAGVTENASGAQESVVTLFKVSTAFSGGTGSITVTQEGQRATVPLPNGQATLGIATFYTFPEPPFPFPHPIPHPIEGL
jgi:hypothetical protein